MDSRVSKFKEIFFGLDRAYGQFIKEDQREDGKETGKAFITKKPVVDQLWLDHLDGKYPSFGVIPITDDSTCRWGCIDVDTYPLDHKALVVKLNTKKLPFIVARSKSGGAHIFVFLKEYAPAKLVLEKMSEIASSIGHGDCEIFPKQAVLDKERGDVGNFLNLPYHNGNNYSTRYAYDDEGNAMNIDKFLEEVEKKSLTIEEFKKLKVTKEKSEFFDAPFCIEAYINENGHVESGNRDNFLFQYAVYAKKKWPDEFEQKIYEFHHKYFPSPLPPKQIEKIVKQSDKKDWGYKCKDQPMCSFCNKSKCKIRKFGIGENSVGAELKNMVMFRNGDESIFHLNVGDQRITLNIDELYDQHRFRKKCAVTVTRMPPMVKREDYDEMINSLLENTEIVEAEYELTMEGQFRNALLKFIRNQGNAISIDEVLAGSCFIDEEKNEIYFRTDQLIEFLKNKKFTAVTTNQVGVWLRSFGGETKQKKIEGKRGQLVWVLANDKFGKSVKIEEDLLENLDEPEGEVPF